MTTILIENNTSSDIVKSELELGLKNNTSNGEEIINIARDEIKEDIDGIFLDTKIINEIKNKVILSKEGGPLVDVYISGTDIKIKSPECAINRSFDGSIKIGGVDYQTFDTENGYIMLNRKTLEPLKIDGVSDFVNLYYYKNENDGKNYFSEDETFKIGESSFYTGETKSTLDKNGKKVEEKDVWKIPKKERNKKFIFNLDTLKALKIGNSLVKNIIFNWYDKDENNEKKDIFKDYFENNRRLNLLKDIVMVELFSGRTSFLNKKTMEEEKVFITGTDKIIVDGEYILVGNNEYYLANTYEGEKILIDVATLEPIKIEGIKGTISLVLYDQYNNGWDLSPQFNLGNSRYLIGKSENGEKFVFNTDTLEPLKVNGGITYVDYIEFEGYKNENTTTFTIGNFEVFNCYIKGKSTILDTVTLEALKITGTNNFIQSICETQPEKGIMQVLLDNGETTFINPNTLEEVFIDNNYREEKILKHGKEINI